MGLKSGKSWATMKLSWKFALLTIESIKSAGAYAKLKILTKNSNQKIVLSSNRTLESSFVQLFSKIELLCFKDFWIIFTSNSLNGVKESVKTSISIGGCTIKMCDIFYAWDDENFWIVIGRNSDHNHSNFWTDLVLNLGKVKSSQFCW